MGTCLRVAMATTVKMVRRQPTTIHLRLIRTRRYSPTADSCGGRSESRRGDRPTSKVAVGCNSRIAALFVCTRGPESMPAPQRICRRLKARPEPACIANNTTSPGPVREGWFVAQEFVSHSIAGEFDGHSNIGERENHCEI